MRQHPDEPLEIRRIRAPEWRLLRSLRLEALQESPLSYGSTHEREVKRPDREWRERVAADAAGVDAVAFAAVADGNWVGMARGYLEPPIAHLIAVYVTPAWRRRGFGRAVSMAVVGWAQERDVRAVVLSVSDWNDGARRVYESIGFAPTGVTKSLPWNPSVMESEMRLELG
jgi:GNAT superfamily N-acetyltransferase